MLGQNVTARNFSVTNSNYCLYRLRYNKIINIFYCVILCVNSALCFYDAFIKRAVCDKTFHFLPSLSAVYVRMVNENNDLAFITDGIRAIIQ